MTMLTQKQFYQSLADAFSRSVEHAYKDMLDAAVRAEREECAKLAESTVCDTHLPTGVRIYGTRAAAAIRARNP